jgi:hypothetical protein
MAMNRTWRTNIIPVERRARILRGTLGVAGGGDYLLTCSMGMLQERLVVEDK